MGSLLQIESSPGVGSRFYFEIAIDAELGAAYDWRPPRALQEMSVAIISPFKMPVMDGYEATRAIRALGGYFEPILIIAITAHALEGDSSKCLDAGMNYYLSKPFEPDYLALTIERFIVKQGRSSDSGPVDLVLQ